MSTKRFLCWLTCIVFAISFLVLDNVSASASYVAASLVIIALDGDD